MKNGLVIASDLSLPFESVTHTFGVLAIRGVGKTHFMRRLAEEMGRNQLPFVFCDPVGVAWGLRSSADGKKPGIPVIIFGGEHGDVPLDPMSGSLVADFIVEERPSVVLDMSTFRTKADQRRFVTDFAERLYRKNREPLHLFLDEADEYCPQRPQRGYERMLGAMEELVRRGRARGIGVTMATQRSAVLNKDVLTQIDTLIALRTVSPQDRKAVDLWVSAHGTDEQRAEFMESLASMPVGTAWVWSPGWLNLFKKVQIARCTTFDSSATPKVGRRLKAPGVMAKVDLDGVRERMSNIIETNRQQDPNHLRRENEELRAEIRRLKTACVKVETKVIEKPIVKDEQITRFEKALGTLSQVFDEAKRARQDAHASGRPLHIPSMQELPNKHIPAPIVVMSKKRAELLSEDKQLRAGARRMLEALAARYPAKTTRSQLATLSGLRPRSGTFGTYFGELKRLGYIQQNGDMLIITDEGFRYSGYEAHSTPQSKEEVRKMWESKLRAGARRMLGCVIDSYPKMLTRQDLADAVGLSVQSGTFGTYLGDLTRNGLVVRDGGLLRLGEMLV